MSAQVVVNETADGWDVHILHGDDVVVRTVGPRITVAVVPDDDDLPSQQPLSVTLEPPSVTSA